MSEPSSATIDAIHVIGLMSGTSMDGVDCAHVAISRDEQGQDRLQLLGFYAESYPDELRERLLLLAEGNYGGTQEISLMNSYLGLFYTDVIQHYLARSDKPVRIDLIGSHGQTLYHSLSDEVYLGRSIRSSLQLGEASYLSERFGCPVISDFRVRDQAAGGLGAPLVPFVEYMLNRDPDRDIIFLNIGGISNITYLPCYSEAVIAFDTGPGNMLIDQAVREYTDGRMQYDRDGLFASAGRSHDGLLQRWMQHPYFELPPPKNAGRENFGLVTYREMEAEAKSLGLGFEDFVASLTRLTALVNAEAIRTFTPNRARRLVVSGGGSRNKRIMEELRGVLPDMEVVNGDKVFSYPNDAKEAVAFAYLAYRRWRGETNTLSVATGAEHNVMMGKISQ